MYKLLAIGQNTSSPQPQKAVLYLNTGSACRLLLFSIDRRILNCCRIPDSDLRRLKSGRIRI